MVVYVAGLILFFATHSIAIVAPGGRDRAVARLGLQAWRGLYSILSLGSLVLLVVGYGQVRNAGPMLYVAPAWMHHVTMTLMLPVFPLLLATYLPGRIRTAAKHPTLVSVKLWAFAHLLSNGSLADVLLFGGFLVWAVADRISLKRRHPSLQITAAPGPWNDVLAVVAGLALYAAVLVWLHRWLIGIPLIP